MTGLFGGVFDPPHNGHVAVAEAARARFALDPLVVLVVADPGHKGTHLDAQARLELARAAFQDAQVELDDHRFTIDLLRAGRWPDPLFVIGADELVDFASWKEPEAVLELARLAVATRPGFPREALEFALARLPRRDRVELFSVDEWDVSSSEVRERVRRGEPIDQLVPASVARIVGELGLYRDVKTPPPPLH